MGQVDHSYFVKVKGLVQGVGFRPFVYRIAVMNELTGWVKNTNESVLITISGKKEKIDSFLKMLKMNAPLASSVETIEAVETEPIHFSGFNILESHSVSDEITEISPDIAVCPECLHDITIAGNRFLYPFVNCTNCGPRFTIIEDIPYDRKSTSMALFPMCGKCREEYDDISDRRFHAQPVACNHCGPRYSLTGGTQTKDPSILLDRTAKMLDSGKVIAIKGLGGFHLACDAFNEAAVKRLRRIKKREAKPFAVMFKDLDAIRMYASLSIEEEASLTSWRRPIVLLELNVGNILPKIPLSLNAGLSRIGIMLPYMPFHHLLFSRLKTTAIVLTSGNFSKEPILIENQDAIDQFLPVLDEIITHDRDILNRTDDSVVIFANRKERLIRRSRGYAPSPFRTSFNLNGIVAFGSDLANCFCIGNGNNAILSQYIGDLDNYDTSVFFDQTLHTFLRLFRLQPSLLVTDFHPDNCSTRLGETFSKHAALRTGDIIPIAKVQHHHAHIASCMAEHTLDEQVIGVSFDGTGFGTDGRSWGAEFMVCDLLDFKRITHLDYMPLPGGDAATEEPWRMAISYLLSVYGEQWVYHRLPIFDKISREKAATVMTMIERNINCPLVSSAGRLFDAVSAILGLCTKASFQAEAPMRLESLVVPGIKAQYSFDLKEAIDVKDVIRGIVNDIERGTSLSIISTKFHNTMAAIILEAVQKISKSTGICKIVLSGGVFQNKYLLEETENRLISHTFDVYSHRRVPSNDGGIALGQAVIAAKRRELCV